MWEKMDGEAYLKTFYKGLENDRENMGVLNFLVKSSTHLKENAHVLDLASGPAIYGAIPVARVASTIVLSDISPELLGFSERWKDGQNNAFNWDPYIKVVLDMEAAHGISSGDSLEDRKTKLKAAMEFAIIDILRPQSVKMSQPFDMVQSSFLGTCCADSHASFLNVWKEGLQYVRPGGDMVISEVCDADHIKEKTNLYSYSIGYDDQAALLGELGCHVLDKQYVASEEGNGWGYSGVAMFHIRRPNT